MEKNIKNVKREIIKGATIGLVSCDNKLLPKDRDISKT